MSCNLCFCLCHSRQINNPHCLLYFNRPNHTECCIHSELHFSGTLMSTFKREKCVCVNGGDLQTYSPTCQQLVLQMYGFLSTLRLSKTRCSLPVNGIKSSGGWKSVMRAITGTSRPSQQSMPDDNKQLHM